LELDAVRATKLSITERNMKVEVLFVVARKKIGVSRIAHTMNDDFGSATKQCANSKI